ncbi:MAG: hypothetical protein ACH0QD_04535 [Tepidibacillus sp.]
MKRLFILLTILGLFLLSSTLALADRAVITETLKDKNGNTWTISGYWDKIEGKRVFYPVPSRGEVWVDASRTELVKREIPKTETITVRDTIKTPTVTIRQKAAGDHHIILSVNNPNYFAVTAHVRLVSKSPDPEVVNLTTQEQRNIRFEPGITELTFDSVKRHEGWTKYDIDLRVVENNHPNVHPDYKNVYKLGGFYGDTPLYITYLPAEVTIESNHGSTPSSFGTDWRFTNPNTIDMEYKAEIIDAKGTKVVSQGRMTPGETITGYEAGVPSYASTNTRTLKVTLDPNTPAPSPKVSQDSFTFYVSSASISLSPSISEAPMETKTETQSTGCAYGPYTYTITYQWIGSTYTVNSTVTNNSNFPIVVTATVDGSSGTYTLAEYASTSGPSTSGTTHDAKSIPATTQWESHSSSSSTTISVVGWREIARESYTCNPPPPPPSN